MTPNLLDYKLNLGYAKILSQLSMDYLSGSLFINHPAYFISTLLQKSTKNEI